MRESRESRHQPPASAHIAIAVLFFAVAHAFAQPSKLPPDLALVPETGVGLIHVKVAELWGHESLKDVRDILKKAGDKAIAALDERFAGLTAPGNVERITVWIGPTRCRSTIDSDFLFFLRLTKPVDTPKLRSYSFGSERDQGSALVRGRIRPGLLIADDRTLVFGSKDEVADRESDPAIGSFLRESIAVAAAIGRWSSAWSSAAASGSLRS